MEDSRGDECEVAVSEFGSYEGAAREDEDFQIGIVLQRGKDYVKVKVFPSPACVGCSRKCSVTERVILLPSSYFDFSPKEGEVVKIRYRPVKMMLLSFLTFVVPSLLLVLMLLLLKSWKEVNVIIVWGVLTVAYFFVLNKKKSFVLQPIAGVERYEKARR